MAHFFKNQLVHINYFFLTHHCFKMKVWSVPQDWRIQDMQQVTHTNDDLFQ